MSIVDTSVKNNWELYIFEYVHIIFISFESFHHIVVNLVNKYLSGINFYCVRTVFCLLQTCIWTLSKMPLCVSVQTLSIPTNSYFGKHSDKNNPIFKMTSMIVPFFNMMINCVKCEIKSWLKNTAWNVNFCKFLFIYYK